LSPEALANLRKVKVSVTPSPLVILNRILAIAHPLSVINKENNSIKEYISILGAVRDIGISHATILNYIKNKLL